MQVTTCTVWDFKNLGFGQAFWAGFGAPGEGSTGYECTNHRGILAGCGATGGLFLGASAGNVKMGKGRGLEKNSLNWTW